MTQQGYRFVVVGTPQNLKELGVLDATSVQPELRVDVVDVDCAPGSDMEPRRRDASVGPDGSSKAVLEQRSFDVPAKFAGKIRR